jgi:hypothetical protein
MATIRTFVLAYGLLVVNGEPVETVT